MKILFLSQRFLLPMDTGGKIRTGKILEQLTKDHSITLISNVESPKDDPYLTEIHQLCTKFIAVPWKEIKKYTPLFFLRLFVQMFSIYPVSALNDYSAKLKNILEKECVNEPFDLAICDFVQSALLFKNIKRIPTVLFQHNVESVIARRHVERATNPLSLLFWWLQWKKMFAYEKNACNFFGRVIAVSENDQELFEELYGISNLQTIATGVDTTYYALTPDITEKKNSLVFCGSMDWLPNEDAIQFFLNDILPVIVKEIPDIRLTVVGRNPSPGLRKKVNNHPEVILTDWVEDTRPYIAESALFIVPIRIGGGTRMKIFEAMAMGKAVVSTSIGAEGLPVTDGDNIIIENSAARFGKRIVALLNDAEKRSFIGNNGCTYVRQNFAWPKVAQQFIDKCCAT
jgi:glycosyltransferase involved in cell wall biosynthesis